MAMQCDEIRPRLDAYVDGALDGTERALFHEHLADCPECGPEVAALERLRAGKLFVALRRRLDDRQMAVFRQSDEAVAHQDYVALHHMQRPA